MTLSLGYFNDIAISSRNQVLALTLQRLYFSPYVYRIGLVRYIKLVIIFTDNLHTILTIIIIILLVVNVCNLIC